MHENTDITIDQYSPMRTTKRAEWSDRTVQSGVVAQETHVMPENCFKVAT
jgi:hypothetical protein